MVNYAIFIKNQRIPMKHIFLLLSLVLFFNSCTNRYERPSSVTYKQKISTKKIVKKSNKKVVKQKIKKQYRKKIKRDNKKVTHYKLNKELLVADYLKYKEKELNIDFFNKNRVLFSLKRVKSIKRYAKKKINNKKAKIVAKKREKKLKKLYLTATAYTSHKNQTDSTPFLAAWNNRIRPGMKIVAVSHDLIKKHGLGNGVKVKIKGLKGDYVVKDKMNKRFKKRIDIYMGLNKKRALQWGKRKVVVYY